MWVRSDLGSHQALTGRTDADARKNERRRGLGFEDSSEFLICKGFRGSGRDPESRGRAVKLAVCSKETQHWWGWRLKKGNLAWRWVCGFYIAVTWDESSVRLSCSGRYRAAGLGVGIVLLPSLDLLLIFVSINMQGFILYGISWFSVIWSSV